MSRRYGWLLVIFLVACLFRLANITDVPPGLTHDEADHGLDAWGVVNGDRPIYFTVGFGREPLFDYATAGLMTFLGPTYLAGRLTAVYFSLILIAGAFAWTRLLFGRRIALLTAAGLAVNFWAVSTGRQALRSVALPALFVLAALMYWRALFPHSRPASPSAKAGGRLAGLVRSTTVQVVAAGLLLGATFYAYIPARVMWFIYPLFLVFLALFRRPRAAAVWRHTLLLLLIAAAIALPLFRYLALNPDAEARLDQLSAPLASAAGGEWSPLLQNVAGGLGMLAFAGDSQWRYNLPGRPVLSPVVALFFFAGLILAGRTVLVRLKYREADNESARLFFSFAWLVAGLSPALVTGPDLSTPRIIGLQPVLFLFPALALDSLLRSGYVRGRYTAVALVGLYFGVVSAQTARDYFSNWANAPEVRVQYETALVAAIRTLDERGNGPAAISTTTPGRFHSPAVALLTSDQSLADLRWFNGQNSLLLPQDEASTLVVSHFAALHADLLRYIDLPPGERLPLRPTDLDSPLHIYEVDGPALLAQARGYFDGQIQEPAGVQTPVRFGDAVELLGYDLLTPVVAPGSEVRLATLWRVRQPIPEGVLFSQLLGRDGRPLAQADRLDAPSDSWFPGDVFVQLHEFDLPAPVEPGNYPLIVGLYTRADLKRLPVLVEDVPVADYLLLRPVEVRP